MGILDKTKSFAKRFQKDERGNMALAWGVCMTAVIMASGAAFDVSQHSKARSMAQMAADNMALAASVAVDFGNDDRYVEHQWYTYDKLGGPSEDFTGTIKGKVEYDVDDNGDGEGDLLARATVKGTYTAAFFPIVGAPTLNFTATSDVAYAQREGTPASIFFVADNSGSMGWADNTGTIKLSSLETSLQNFMTTLSTLDNDGTADTFRTALYPYSADPNGNHSGIDDDGVVPAHVVDPAWGTISTGNITRMYARSGTDSSGALQDAADAFALEAAIHEPVNTEDDPLKFLVFMTDGANNESYECTTEEVWVDNMTAEYWWKRRRNGTIRKKYRQPRNWWNWNYVAPVADGTGYYEEQEVCSWDYHFDVRSLEACDQMKEDGVLIYAIAYDVAASQKAHAEEFMENCSSGDDFFKSAGDSSALSAAFAEIGESIVKEVIRIKK